MRPEIVEALPEHIAHIAEHVRAADRLEFSANLQTAQRIMFAGLRISTKAWTGLVNGEPVCMYGVAAVGGMLINHGRPWMVGTDLLDKYAVLFLRRCKPQVEEMLNLYPVLSNYVAASNIKAIEWLKWMGFKVSEESKSHGINGMPFLHFELRRDHAQDNA